MMSPVKGKTIKLENYQMGKLGKKKSSKTRDTSKTGITTWLKRILTSFVESLRYRAKG